MSEIFSFDPLSDNRWAPFLERQPNASIFHTVGWLTALRRAYGYQPIVYTTSPPGEDLRDGLLFCRINTWLSGRRLVSVPFSDHAAILVEDKDVFGQMFSVMSQQVATKVCRYVEIRPVEGLAWDPLGLRNVATYYWHRLSLERELAALYQSFHKNCVQRKIKRAEREGITYTEGRTEELIQQFHRLLLLTHRRHGIPPQPVSWFRDLVGCLGADIKIRVASKDGVAVASIITLTYKDSMVYKYGCSDEKYHNLGGMVFLIWRAIQDAKTCGLKELDLGRTDCGNAGLVNFKENWGAEQSTLVYWGYPATFRPSPDRWDLRAMRRILVRLPKTALAMSGRLLYRHMG